MRWRRRDGKEWGREGRGGGEKKSKVFFLASEIDFARFHRRKLQNFPFSSAPCVQITSHWGDGDFFKKTFFFFKELLCPFWMHEPPPQQATPLALREPPPSLWVLRFSFSSSSSFLLLKQAWQSKLPNNPLQHCSYSLSLSLSFPSLPRPPSVNL